MKNVKLIMVVVTTMLFLGLSRVNAQGKSVMIRAEFQSNLYNIMVVSPNSQVVENKAKKITQAEFLIVLKQEIDKWLAEGYKIAQSYGYSLGTTGMMYEIIILTKEE